MLSALALRARDAELERFYFDDAFRQQFLWALRLDLWYRPAREVRELADTEIKSAIAAGVLRAWMLRFLTEHHPEFHLSRRRNIADDHDRVVTCYPEFLEYIPDTPLDPRDVLRSARQEFAHQFLIPERNAWQRRPLSICGQIPDSRAEPAIFGPAVLRVGSRLLVEYGLTATVTWIFARYIFDDEYRTTIRALWPGLEADPVRFRQLYDTLRRDLTRMDLAVAQMQSDVLLQDVHAGAD